MKLHTLVLSLVVSLALVTTASARDLVFGLSPYQSSEAAKSQVEQALLFAATHLKADDTAFFFDAANVRLIGTFTVPEGRAYESPRARLQANRAVVGALKTFFEHAEAVPGRIGAGDWPGLFELLRSSYPAEEGVALILLGAPIADDPRAPSVSMIGGRVPNDGHIAATAAQSPYGTMDLPGTLEGYDVFMGLAEANWYVSDAHDYAVARFWSLSAEAHGAAMAYFGDDVGTLYRLVADGATGRAHAEPLVGTDKLEMLSFAPDNGSVPALYEARPQEAPASAPVWQNARQITIGATWDQGVDMDLYVRPKPTSEVIYYGNANPASGEGRLFKDIRNGLGAAFETVALSGGPFDVSQMQIALNYYGGGSAPSGVTGELRIAIGDEVWAAPFHVTAQRGNRGAGDETALVDQILPNDAWVLIDPLEVLGVE